MKYNSTFRIAPLSVAFGIAFASFTAIEAEAAAIITNGTIMIGVNDLGALNVDGGPPATASGTTVVGLRFVPTGSDSTSPGCTCEGWGAGIANFGAPGNNVSGYNNTAIGTANLSLVSFTSTASTAVSVANVLGATGGPILQVKHDYHPIAGTPFLYQVDVSITNLSGVDLTPGQLVYRRVMDWDIPFPGSEHVDIQGVPLALGVANGNNVRRTDNNGFNSGDPFSFSPFGLTNINFTDATGDIGALFDFEFEALANGATRTFTTFYGAAPTKAAADLARALVDGDSSDIEIGLYSYGYPSTGLDGIDLVTGAPDTFIFGFGAVGGVFLPPDGPGPTPTPEPATLALLGLGLAGLGWSRRRKTA